MFYYEYISENLKELNNYKGRLAIYPCGINGERTVKVLKEIYSIVPDYLIDNNRCKNEEKYFSLEEFKEIYEKDILLIDPYNYLVLLGFH